jgi:hypothetical protein
MLDTRLDQGVVMYSPPSSPLSVGGVIDDGIRLFRESFNRCWLLAIIPGLVLILFEIAFPTPLPSFAVLRNPLAARAITNSPHVLLLDLLSLLLGLVFQGAVLVRQIAIASGDDSVTFGSAAAVGFRRLLTTLIAFVLFSLAVAGGMILLLIPGLYILPRLQLWMVAVFVDDQGPTTALGSSWRLTKGHWWRVTAILTVAAIIILVLTLVFSALAGWFAVNRANASARMLVVQVVSLGSAAISYPLGTAIGLAMYHDLKLRREGGDIATRASALGSSA